MADTTSSGPVRVFDLKQEIFKSKLMDTIEKCGGPDTGSSDGMRSFARVPEVYKAELEKGINEQINFQMSISWNYLSMQHYFARDTVALGGMSKYFAHAAEHDYKGAQKLMCLQARVAPSAAHS